MKVINMYLILISVTYANSFVAIRIFLDSFAISRAIYRALFSVFFLSFDLHCKLLEYHGIIVCSNLQSCKKSDLHTLLRQLNVLRNSFKIQKETKSFFSLSTRNS